MQYQSWVVAPIPPPPCHCSSCYHPPPAPAQLRFPISVWGACFHQLHTCLHHIYISQPVRVGESLAPAQMRPPSSHQHIRLTPTKNAFHPPLVERIPICPGAKFQPCFLGTKRPGFSEPPQRRAQHPLPPQGPKTLQIIEGEDTEVFLLTRDRYRWAIIKMLMLETELCDTAGTAMVSEVYIFRMNGPCYISCVLTSCIVEYSLKDTINQYQNSSELTNSSGSDTSVPLRDTCLDIQVQILLFVSPSVGKKKKKQRGELRRERTCMRHYIPPRSIKQAWEDVREGAWGCSGMVHSYLHRWTLLALTWQPSASSSAEHTVF